MHFMRSVSKCYTVVSYNAVFRLCKKKKKKKSAVYLSVYRVRLTCKIQELRSMTIRDNGQLENSEVLSIKINLLFNDKYQLILLKQYCDDFRQCHQLENNHFISLRRKQLENSLIRFRLIKSTATPKWKQDC